MRQAYIVRLSSSGGDAYQVVLPDSLRGSTPLQLFEAAARQLSKWLGQPYEKFVERFSRYETSSLGDTFVAEDPAVSDAT